MVDLEKLNRQNYRSLLEALSTPGEKKDISPLHGSTLLAIANVLLYSEVSYFYSGDEDMSLVEAVTYPKVTTDDKADYVFSDTPCIKLIQTCKRGDHLNPDFSATLVFKTDNINSKVFLSGPGIDGKKEVDIPLSREILKTFIERNSEYPLGIELFVIEKNSVTALSRTTKVEVM